MYHYISEKYIFKKIKNVFLLEALKGLTSLAMVTKAMSAVGQIGGGGVSGMRSGVGASVSWVDGHVAEGIRPSRCERGDDDT